MRTAHLAMRRRGGWVAALMVLVASLVFVGEAAAQPIYGIATGKQCAGPINVGDPYVCVASISNTNSTSLGTVTTTAVQDQVFHPDGTTAGAPQTVLINSSHVLPAGPVHLIDNPPTGGVNAPSCDATKCTIPFGDEVTVGLSHYTAQLQDVGSSGLGQNTLSDIANFSYRQVCDKPVAGFPCSTALNISGSGAATDVNPVPTTTTTAIHDATHAPVTTVTAGTTVHDFVTVSSGAGNPIPTGNVTVDWFLNGTCAGAPAVTSAATALGAGGTVDVTGFAFTVNSAGQRAFQAHYLGDGNTPSQFAPSTGGCEPLTVVDAFIQITPQNASERGRHEPRAHDHGERDQRRRARGRDGDGEHRSPRRARPAASSARPRVTTRVGRRRRAAPSRSPPRSRADPGAGDLERSASPTRPGR